MEFTQETVTWMINGIFAFFLVMGFLFGAARGVKKSALRLVFLSVIAGGMYFGAPYISSWLLSYNFSSLLNISIDINGTAHQFTTIQGLMTAYIESSQALQDFITANPSFTTIVEQLPTIVTNLIVFLAGFWMLKVLTWPIFAIMAIGYNKRKEDGSKPKKHRFVGALLGLTQGAMIALVTFMPVAGVSSILSAQGAGGETLLANLLPQDMAGFVSVYENSAMGMFGGMGDLDNKMFDGLTTIQTTNPDTGETYTIKPRQEAVTGMEIANDIQTLINMVKGIQDGTITEIDWALIESLVDKVFTLNTIQLAIEEYAPYLLDEAINNPEYGISEEIDSLPISVDVREFLQEFVTNLNEATILNMKTDVMAFVNMGKALDEHGVLDLVFDYSKNLITEKELGEQILQIFGTNRDLSNDIVVAVLGSNSIKTLMPAAMNMALGYVEYAVNEGRPQEDTVLITRINASEIDWNLEAEYLTDIMFNLYSFAYSIDPFNIGENVDPITLVASLELSKLGDAVNILRSTQLFCGEVYESLIEAVLSMPEIIEAAGQYVDFDALITALNTTDWANEFNTIEQLVDLYVLISSNQVPTKQEIVTIIESLNSELLELVIDGAVRAVFIEGFEENIGSFINDEFVFAPEFIWLDDLNLSAISSNADFFADLIVFGFEVANNGLDNLTYEQLTALADTVEALGETETLTPEEVLELEQFKSFFNNFLHYMITKVDSQYVWIEGISVDDMIEHIDTMVALFNLALAVEDESIVNYTPEQIQALVDEIKELNNMSPEMIVALQGFYDEFIAENSPLLVQIDIASIDFNEEADLIGGLLNLYIANENGATLEEVETIADAIVIELQNSYVADQILSAALLEIMDDEQAPLWVNNVDMTWVSDNAGLAAELIELAVWTQNNDLGTISQAQIDELQLEVNNIPVSPEYAEFSLYMQDFVTSLSN